VTMKTLRLGGRDGVSMVCLGTMTFGLQTSEDEAFRMLDVAVKERGVTFIDCAELYPVPSSKELNGEAERILGKWLAGNKDLRSQLVVATKVVGSMKSTFIGLGRRPENDFKASNYKGLGGREATRLSKEQIKIACNASLHRLQLDYIDLFYLHWPDRRLPMFGNTLYDPTKRKLDAISFQEQVEAVGELLQEGKIKAWALSNENAFGVCEICHECARQNVPKPVAIQNCFNLVNRSFETDSVAEACFSFNHDLPLVMFSPLCGGVLTGKYKVNASPPPDSRVQRFEKFKRQFAKPPVVKAAELYGEIAGRHRLSLKEMAQRWLLDRPCTEGRSCVIVGSKNVEQLKSNLDDFGKGPLPQEVKDEIDQVYMRFKNPANIL